MNLIIKQKGVFKFHPNATKVCKAINTFRDSVKKNNLIQKETALINYLVNAVDMENSIFGLRPDRAEKSREEFIEGEGFTPEQLSIISEIEDRYRQSKLTLKHELVDAGMRACHQLINYFNLLNLDERDNNGKLIHDPKKVQRMLNDLQGTYENLENLEKMAKTLAGESDDEYAEKAGFSILEKDKYT